jgi:hypothetical protein
MAAESIPETSQLTSRPLETTTRKRQGRANAFLPPPNIHPAKEIFWKLITEAKEGGKGASKQSKPITSTPSPLVP